MSIQYPPLYRYNISKDWSKKLFEEIKEVGLSKSYPKLNGTKEEKNQFLITLIRTQKALHGWEAFLIDTLKRIKDTGLIIAKDLNEKYPPESIDKEIPQWVTYKEDKIVNDFIDDLFTKKIEFVGTDKEMGEFVTRFILGQLGLDWEQTIMMIWELLGEKDTIYLTELNNEMKNFDYLKIFE